MLKTPSFDDARPAGADVPAEDLASLSAQELVARIEAEEAMVAQFERRRVAGAAALLRAALARAAEAAPVEPPTIRMPGQAQHADPRRRAA